ncbi:hypothetical protein BB561_005554 [Smittium simulii]|uniref:Uncharacterized protein n=1 Tax=Smittium simulii TaxID=133385 RepID=A0A2T9Y9T9_9FUNG|nr:hypothetical protein BB561_005554 [Smittium simulii]
MSNVPGVIPSAIAEVLLTPAKRTRLGLAFNPQEFTEVSIMHLLDNSIPKALKKACYGGSNTKIGCSWTQFSGNINAAIDYDALKIDNEYVSYQHDSRAKATYFMFYNEEGAEKCMNTQCPFKHRCDTWAGTSCNWMGLELVYPELKTHINYVFKIQNGTYWTARRYAKSGFIKKRFIEECPFCRNIDPETIEHMLLKCASQKFNKIKKPSNVFGQVLKKNKSISRENKIQMHGLTKKVLLQDLLQKKDFDDTNYSEAEIELKTKLELCEAQFEKHKKYVVTLFESLNKTVIEDGVYDSAAYSKIGEILAQLKSGEDKISNCVNEIVRYYNNSFNITDMSMRSFYDNLVKFIHRRNDYKNFIKKIKLDYEDFKRAKSNDYKKKIEYIMALVGSDFK